MLSRIAQSGKHAVRRAAQMQSRAMSAQATQAREQSAVQRVSQQCTQARFRGQGPTMLNARSERGFHTEADCPHRLATPRLSLLRVRPFPSAVVSCQTLTDHVSALVPKLRADLKELKATYGNKSLGEVKVEQVIGGMRGMTGLLTETSLLDANEGIRFRGYTIPDCQKYETHTHGHE